MQFRTVYRLACAILVMLSGLSPTTVVGQREPDKLLAHSDVAASLRVFDRWVELMLENRNEPGLAIGIVHDQKLIWSKGYGYADIEKEVPIDSATLFRIASITKLFTSTAIMQLRDAGQLRLDDPVDKYLPWFKLDGGNNETPEVLVWNLLTHTSGLPRDIPGTNWDQESIPNRKAVIGSFEILEQVFPTAKHWKYSNLGFVSAGEIIAEITGATWEEYVQENILDQLGMRDSTPSPDIDMPGLAIGYTQTPEGQPHAKARFLNRDAAAGAGNIASSIRDMAKFIALQFQTDDGDEPNVLRPPTLREMHRVQWLGPEWRSAWGLGFWIRRVGSETRVGHGGRLAGYSSALEFIPDKEIGVVVLQNVSDGSPELYMEKAFQMVVASILQAAEPLPSPPVAHPEWAKYEGTYTGRTSSFEIMVLNGQLLLVFTGSDQPWASRVVLKPMSTNKFMAVPDQIRLHPTTMQDLRLRP